MPRRIRRNPFVNSDLRASYHAKKIKPPLCCCQNGRARNTGRYFPVAKMASLWVRSPKIFGILQFPARSWLTDAHASLEKVEMIDLFRLLSDLP
jgi:hypothetical protein